jgi:pimeloyl-ACP methyl ester carboxylesterase
MAVAGAGVALTSELRHRKSVQSDPQWELLRAPLHGVSVTARSADSTELHAEIFGPDDAPTFVLIPGWTEELEIFDLLTRGLLGRGYRVVGYDPRGQGSSGRTAGLDQLIERYGEDLAAVLESTCESREDVIVVGHSMGGMSVVAWAAHVDVSAHVRAASLISTGISGLVDDLGLLPTSLPVDTRRTILTPLLAGEQPLVQLSTPVSRALNRHLMFGPDATAGMVAFVEPMIWRMQPKLRAAAAKTMRDLDLSEALTRLNVPTLVVVGDSDRLTPPVHAQRMMAVLPQAELLVLLRTGHMVPLERPLELLEALVKLGRSVGIEPAAEAAARRRQTA